MKYYVQENSDEEESADELDTIEEADGYQSREPTQVYEKESWRPISAQTETQANWREGQCKHYSVSDDGVSAFVTEEVVEDTAGNEKPASIWV